MARPKSFDPEEALTKAMHAFWAKGYDATSVTDLTNAMGINKFSLYDTFGDKRSVFLKTLHHYRALVAQEQFRCLAPGAGLAEIHTFFDQLLNAPHELRDNGCLMMNSLVDLSGSDPEIDDLLQVHFKWGEKQFARALKQAQKDGDLSSDLDVNRKAKSLIALIQGVIALSKAKFGRPMAKAAVQDGLSQLAA